MSWLREIRDAFFCSVPAHAKAEATDQKQVLLRADIPVRRQVNELLGLLKGVMADGIVRQKEAHFLIDWLEKNEGTIDRWPANAIYPRLKSALSDGNLDDAEEAEIHDLILTALEESRSGEDSHTPALPYSALFPETPLPEIQFDNHLFCFAGRFRSGNHSWCVKQVIARGGMSAAVVSQRVNYLVVGEMGNRGRTNTKIDSKIAKAMKYSKTGAGITILSEQYWFESLMQHTTRNA